jgi:glutathione S-transferase
MTLTLYSHPLASFCHKVLIALYEAATPFTAKMVDFSDEESARQIFDRWPVGKMPVLHDEARDRILPETSIIIDYLNSYHPASPPLLPSDADQLLKVRLWDRFFDLYVSVPMQKIVGDRLRPAGAKDPFGVQEARDSLATAYGMIDGQARKFPWAAGEHFSMADCAAAPALFYADLVEPIPLGYEYARAYRQALIRRPSVARVLDEAKPYFQYFPFRETLPAEYRDGSF